LFIELSKKEKWKKDGERQLSNDKSQFSAKGELAGVYGL